MNKCTKGRCTMYEGIVKGERHCKGRKVIGYGARETEFVFDKIPLTYTIMQKKVYQGTFFLRILFFFSTFARFFVSR